MKPEMNMTKTAGPSAESANEKSRPQYSQRGCSARNPWNSRPLPQRGQRPSSPATIGDRGRVESEGSVTTQAFLLGTACDMAYRAAILKIWLACDRTLFRSLQRHEVAQHGRNELRHGRMDVHRPLQDRARSLGIHDIENAMNDLVARQPQKRSPEDLLRFLVHQDLHETLGLTLLIGAAHVLHGHGRDQRRPTALAHVGLGHAGAAKRGIGVERISIDTVADPPRLVVKNVGRDDLEIVP